MNYRTRNHRELPDQKEGQVALPGERCTPGRRQQDESLPPQALEPLMQPDGASRSVRISSSTFDSWKAS